MKTLYVILTVLVLVGSLAAADGTLTRDEQIRIIQDYQYVTGRSSMISQALGEELGYADAVPIKSGSPAILEYLANRDKIDKDLLISMGVTDVERPILDLSYDSPGGHFRIHYTKTGTNAVYQPTVDSDGDGVPNYVESMALIADSVYDREVNALGFPPPVPDTLCAQGEDARYDIYVLNLSSNIFGLTYPDVDCPPDPGNFVSVPAFLELDNDYQHISVYKDHPLDAVRVTVAHEFFHAIQFGLYFSNAWTSENMYWLEMSATWMEEYNYDNINDYYSYLPYFLDVPRRSLQQFSTGGDLHPYGAVIFPIYLSEKYGPGIIKAIWMRCRDLGLIGGSFLQAADDAIDSASAGAQSIGSAFGEFARWNYFTGSRWSLAQPGERYSEGQNYPPIPEDAIGINSHYPVTVRADDDSSGIRPQHMAASYIRFEDTRTIEEDRFYVCDSGSFDTRCYKRTEIFDTVATPYELWDSIFTADCPYQSMRVITPGDTTTYPWGLTVVYQLEAIPDSFIVESMMLPSVPTARISGVLISAARVNRFRSITLIFSPASPEKGFYSPIGYFQLGYRVDERGLVDSSLINIPAAILTPYPNPAVVATMGGENMKFRFRAPTDSLSFPIYDSVMVVKMDFFDVAGQHVAAITSPSLTDRYEPFVAEWDMKNQAGKDVASGVYLCYVRLYSEDGKTLLAEDKMKVAVIR